MCAPWHVHILAVLGFNSAHPSSRESCFVVFGVCVGFPAAPNCTFNSGVSVLVLNPILNPKSQTLLRQILCAMPKLKRLWGLKAVAMCMLVCAIAMMIFYTYQ